MGELVPMNLAGVAPLQIEMYLTTGMAIFLLIIGGLAYMGWSRTSTIADFAIADAQLGPYVLGAAFAATFFSAATFVGFVGWSHMFGYSNLWIFMAVILASPLGLILYAKRVRNLNVDIKSLSLPDWLGGYYDSQLLRVGAALALWFNVFYIASQLTAGAQIFEVLLGWDYQVGLAFIVSLVTVYVFIGATWADVYTDAVQAVAMAIMGIIVFVSAFWIFGDGLTGTFSTITAELAAQNPNLVQPVNPESFIYYSAFAIFAVFFFEFVFVAQPQLFNKVLALEDPDDFRKMISTFVVLTFCFCLVYFAGLYYRVLNPDLSIADQTIFLYIEQYFPAAFAAFLGVVILSAVLSTTDGIYIVLATALANDIFLKFLVEEGHIEMEDDRAERVSQYIARASILLVGVLAVVVVLVPPPSLGVLIWIASGGIASATVAPIILGIFFPDFVTRKGAISALVIGLVGFTVKYGFFPNQSVLVDATYGVFLSTAVMVIISAVTTQEPGVAGGRQVAQDDDFDSGAPIASNIEAKGGESDD